MTIRYSFDSLSLRGDRLFGWGWLLSERGPAQRIELLLDHAGGGRSVLRCQQSGSRPDLATAFPACPHAEGAGFLLQGRLHGPSRGCKAILRVQHATGDNEYVELTGFPDRYLTATLPGRLQGRWDISRQLLAGGQWRVLFGRGMAMIGRSIAGLMRRLNARRPVGVPSARSVLVFDHAMGGGANHFRAGKVEEWQRDGRTVILVTPHLPTLSYEVAQLDGGSSRVARYPDLAACLAALPGSPDIVLNSLVSYDDPGLVLDWVAGQRRAGARITFYLHDYHAACPVWTLVDDTGRYCGVPALSRCAECLSANDAPFLALMPELDIASWRHRWGQLLESAEQVVAFSQASVAVLRKAFPALSDRQLVVQPHRIEYIVPQRVAYRLDLPLTIAVVGHINRYKGAGIVAEMARLIEAESLPARIVVIGSIDGVQASPALRVTGTYESAELPRRLESEHVGVCLLPSICQETFSYVTAELMAYGLPLAVFDLGAPAERVRNYPLGRIIDRVDARAALDCLFRLRDDLLADSLGQGGALPAGPP